MADFTKQITTEVSGVLDSFKELPNLVVPGIGVGLVHWGFAKIGDAMDVAMSYGATSGYSDIPLQQQAWESFKQGMKYAMMYHVLTKTDL